MTVRQSANDSANGIDLTSLGAESPTNDARADNGKAGYRPGQQAESLEAQQAPTSTTNVYPKFGRVRQGKAKLVSSSEPMREAVTVETGEKQLPPP